MLDERKSALAKEFGLEGIAGISPVEYAILDGLSNCMYGQSLLARAFNELGIKVDCALLAGQTPTTATPEDAKCAG